MISNFSVQAYSIENLQTYFCNIGLQEEFPILTLDRGSYVVSSQIESGVNLKEGGVHSIQIGQFTSIAHNVIFLIDLNHNYSNVTSGVSKLFGNHLPDPSHRKGQILIGNDVWIGRGTTILGGVTIGNGAVISANSHIIKDVPPYAIVGGNPAKVIKYRFEKEIIEQLQVIQWWNWSNQKIEQNQLLLSDIGLFCDTFYDRAAQEFIDAPVIDLNLSTSCNYLFLLDINQPYPLWKKVITSFTSSFQNDTDKTLIIFIDNDADNKYHIDEIMKYIDPIEATCGLYLYAGSEVEKRGIFRSVSYFITNRSPETVRYWGYAIENDISVISGVDIPIFK